MVQGDPDPIKSIQDLHDQEQTGDSTPGRGRRPTLTGDPVLDAKRQKDRERYAAKKGRAVSVEPVALPAREVFEPESCKILVKLPFDVAGAWFKSESWALDQNETELLAGPCASTLNEFFPQISPKWAALTAFSLVLLTITGKKYMMWTEEVKARKVEEEKRQAMEGGK